MRDRAAMSKQRMGPLLLAVAVLGVLVSTAQAQPLLDFGQADSVDSVDNSYLVQLGVQCVGLDELAPQYLVKVIQIPRLCSRQQQDRLAGWLPK
jgi:hypothetical protein